MLDKRLIMVSVFILLLLGSIIYVSTIASPNQYSARKTRKIRHHIHTLRAVITNINEYNVTLQHGNRSKTFSLFGRWILAKDNRSKIINGSSISNYFSVGDNISATIVVFNRNSTRHVFLLKMAKDGIHVVRVPKKAVLRRNIRKTRVVDIEARIKSIRGKFFVIGKNNRTVVVVGKGLWIVAGGNTTSWSNLLSRLNENDRVWIHGRIVLLKKGFKGVKLFLYPKAIIDITNGFSAIRK